MQTSGDRQGPAHGAGLQNHLLKHLDREGRRRLLPHMKLEALQQQAVLYQADARIANIYFPESAVLCMLTMMNDGRTIESATVGNEGASWISASLGAPTMPCQTMVSVGGMAYKIAVKSIEEEIRRNGVFHDLLSEYAHALLISSLRTGACNALHSLTQRCARWMLVTLDRTTEDRFVITQEFLASLLGCTRPVLGGILSDLEQAGSLHTRRGAIEVVDRQKLEAASCECYGIIHKAFASFLARERQAS